MNNSAIIIAYLISSDPFFLTMISINYNSMTHIITTTIPDTENTRHLLFNNLLIDMRKIQIYRVSTGYSILILKYIRIADIGETGVQ